MSWARDDSDLVLKSSTPRSRILLDVVTHHLAHVYFFPRSEDTLQGMTLGISSVSQAERLGYLWADPLEGSFLF